MKKPIFFLLGLALAFVACKDDEASKTNTEKLTSGKWQITASVAKFTSNGVEQTVDVYAITPACRKDNTAEFKTDGSLIADEGATKCSTNDPQQETGTWTFEQNETHLHVVGTDYSFEAEILELSDSVLKVKYDTAAGGITTTTETTFEKI